MTAGFEQRLGVLQDERSILRALQAYGHGLDFNNENEFLDVFSDDGVLHWPNRPPVEGRSALQALFRNRSLPPAGYQKHFLIEPCIRVEGDRATVESSYARIERGDGKRRLVGFGRYLDIVVRCADGRWRVKERRCESQMDS